MFRRLLQLLLIGGLAYSGWHYRDQIEGLYREFEAQRAGRGKAQAVPDPERYQVLKDELELKRIHLSKRYGAARTATEISLVHTEARETLEEELPKLMRCWLGTPWDFSGTAQIPGEGKIACGYYVSTVMRDAGFKVERIRLAQQASQNIIGTFLPRDQMHVRAGMNYQKFLAEVAQRGPGVRIVGLDKHVAFLVVTNEGEVRFIHSSGGAAKSVVDQNQEEATTLQRSRYRVTGNITGSDEVVHEWLMGASWKTQL
ncbi:MAG: hypothetical protein ACN4GG_12240 [Akkermansiaceae bacterium]|mgnify:CR=1 FL=1